MDVKEFLAESGVAFEVVPHEEIFTAQEVAAAEHVPGATFAKTVLLRGSERVYMMVLPAPQFVDLEAAGKIVGEDVSLASEEDTADLFGDCEVGAEHPFGSKYGVQVFVDEGLAQQQEIVFRAGTHHETVKMNFADYERLEQPTVCSFAVES